jgi:DinB superfamily
MQHLEELPADLRAIVEALDESDGEARRIIGELSDEQANWQPSETAWSIAQCIDHLARSNSMYAVALQEAVTGAGSSGKARRDAIRPGGWVSAQFIRSLEPPPKQKMRAPKKIIPASRVGAREALEAFLDATKSMRAVVRDGAGLDLNRIRFKNPFFGFLRFTVGSGLLITSAHNRRHLWQAEQVRRAAGFPG